VGLRMFSIMRGPCGSGPLLDGKCDPDPLKHAGRLPCRASLLLPVCGRRALAATLVTDAARRPSPPRELQDVRPIGSIAVVGTRVGGLNGFEPRYR
jgi:hypothetical protein